MNGVKGMFVLATAVAAVGLSVVGCAAEPQIANAPEVDDLGVAEADEGWAYNGWSQVLSYTIWLGSQYPEWRQTLTRSFGDSTRGGGACSVIVTSTACSSDALCVSNAQASYGPSAWGYCYQSKCHSRAWSQSVGCIIGSSRSSGNTVIGPTGGTGTYQGWADAVLGCMTKTAGPNSACGGTDPSAYVRSVKLATYTSAEVP